MPFIDFKGKQYIYSHHLTVPFRELVIDQAKSMPKQETATLEDNLIIHGDNLHALKALLPNYAGKIKCIYIDPPYNTGNEGWCYNDNINSPLMRDWSKNANPVDNGDLERHDKWLCMMWPRLQLLHELLTEDGVIFVSIDDNEHSSLKLIMDEIFGIANYLTSFVWKRRSGSNDSKNFLSVDHDYVVCYHKSNAFCFNGLTKDLLNYKNLDKDPRGGWAKDNLTCNKTKEERPNLYYNIQDPNTGIVYSANPNRVWAYEKERMKMLIEENKILFPKSGRGTPQYKRHLCELRHLSKPISSWIISRSPKKDISNISASINSIATKELRSIFGEQVFNYPKPVDLVKALIHHSTNLDSIILDSFAGSGTTAHAVLDLNKEDGGNRKFILVEMEDYADNITAERVRRVIKGVPTAKDEKLKKGLDGSFTYCELGEAIDIEKILSGESLPNYSNLARYVFYTATGHSLTSEATARADFYIGETDLYELYLIYKPDITFLRSNDSALNADKLKIIKARASSKQKLVFATAKYMGQNELSLEKITFCQLPYAIHKIACN